ncbi:hypothetical protein CVV26_00245 [Candidatus Kuenenbacteria bacterium HGW-Kuenenbacteria-1]|uniref:Uncharacterized protein n=1 Tax=Candidatus Kuenenbacteria bacterium HGW-Kuenenbacteria-1 TaxID=2013812 RepID=A0A2N1UP63_9BACT|nr:MAG: hypothetical protein CVV26_00245 [Candidatus Kuenenbacteria bacterium HGW-Kuenenbacteria-1]
METIFDEIFKALGYLFIAGIVYFAWKTANDNATGGKYKTVLWKGFLWCAGIALFASITLGNPTCEERSDPVYGGCEQYADDGYEPTTEQRAAKFAYFMTLLYIPVVIGALKKR